MEKHYKKLSIDFPDKEYIYLKMACAKQNISIKEFVTRAIIRSIEDFEDDQDSASLGIARKEIAEEGAITMEELEKRLGWDKV